MNKEPWIEIVMANGKSRDGARLIMFALSLHATANGVARVPTERLAKLSALSHRQTIRAINSAIGCGDLKLITKGNGRGNSTVYQITVKPIIPFHQKSRKKRAKLVALKGDITKPPLFAEKDDILTPFSPGRP